MAQYYNFVTNASGTLTLEDVQRLCSVEGQSVQLVVEGINNGVNGSQQFLTYTTAPQNSEQAIFSPQINLGSQISATQLEQGQNVFIIKTNTNELVSCQKVLKTTTVNTNTVNGNIVNIVDNIDSKALIGCNNDGQQIQWIKMQENNISVNAVSKQGALISEKTQTSNLNKNQNHISQTHLHGPCELSPLNTDLVKRKPLKLYQNRNRQSTNSVQTETSTLEGVNVTNNIGTQIQPLNVSNVRSPTSSLSNKSISPAGQNVTQISTQIHTPLNTVYTIPQTPNRMSNNSLKLQQSKMKQARFKQMQNSKQMQNDQRVQGNNVQRLSNVSPQSMHLVQRQQSNAVQPRQQLSVASPFQKQTQKSQYDQPSSISSPPQNVFSNTMDVESPVSPNSEGPTSEGRTSEGQTSVLSQPDVENTPTESIAYVQKVIDNPSNTRVQQQIEGSTAKMLVIFTNGEQRLITFDVPNDSTVNDLLEQANIKFCSSTKVSLVSDCTLGINYIVEPGPGSVNTLHDIETDGSQDNSNNTLDNSHSSPDENSNPVQLNEEPIYIEGMLAVCSHCGISSLDFNRCLRCKRKLPKDVKSISMTMGVQEKKETMLSVDTFYKKNNERNSSAKIEKLERDGSIYKRGRGRGGRGIARVRPIHKEPECLTISSDEDEDGKNRKSEGFNNNACSRDTSNSFNEEMETILEKEPVITNNSVSSTSADYAMDNEVAVKDNSIPSPHTSLLCRTVRIGSYKYVPQERVIISKSGVRFGVPLLEDDKSFVTLEVKFQDIVKVLIHFGKSMPVLFFYTSTNSGAMIRELLGMQDPKGPYYDPAGKDHTHKRITLLPEKLNEESKVVLKNLFSRKGLLEELSSKEANDILVRASPRDSLQVQSLSKRENQSATSTNASSNGGIQTLTVYPPPPAKGGIAINTEDYLCLGEDQFLNDVIIDFYLKYLTLKVLSESDQQRTHVFSSYFYKRLTSPHAQAAESSVPLSPAAKRHARVQKWTKNVNIFEKDFIIIPINEHAHWFLAIICFPGLVGEISAQTTHTKESSSVRETVQKSKKLKEVKVQTVTIGSATLTPVTATITIDQADDGSERDEAEGDDEEMEMESEEDEESETTEDKNQSLNAEESMSQEKDTVKVPCILIFDSLAGASRSRVVATLRDYLTCEYIAKMGSEKVFSKDTIKGASLKVPQQSNFTDCGLYVLQYVESFFKDPIKNYTLPIKTLKNWFEEIVVTRKREELSKLLISLMNSTKGDKSITIPVVNFPTQDGKLKIKSENHSDMKTMKTDVESKKKPTLEGENRVSNNMPNQMENTEQTNEIVNRATTYQIIPYSPCTSSNSNESTTEMFEPKTTHPRSSSETMSYLKSKRIPRLMLRTENQDDTQAAKKHKGESFDSCK